MQLALLPFPLVKNNNISGLAERQNKKKNRLFQIIGPIYLAF